jgi:predicted N-acetyltransferase YhbS
MDELVVTCISEESLTSGDRRSIGRLLAEAFRSSAYRERAHRGVAPEFRVVVRDTGGHIVGARSAFRLRNDRGLVAYGLGDVAVQPRAQGRGVASRLIDEGIAEARRRGARMLLTYTEALREAYLRRGFIPASHLIEGDDLPEWCDLALMWVDRGVTIDGDTPVRISPADF